MNSPSVLTVELRLYSLSYAQLNNLASEFCGKPLDVAGEFAATGYVDYEFETIEYKRAFESTLNGAFRL